MVSVSIAVLYNDKAEFLIAKRPGGKEFEGLYEFVGGKIEENESPDKALIRELQEEIGIDLAIERLEFIDNLQYDYPGKKISFYIYAADISGSNCFSKEGQELIWVSQQELMNIKMPDANKEIIKIVFK